VPGLGRAYFGQIEDAKNSFLYTSGFGLLSLIMKKNNKNTISIGFSIISIFFWSTDFIALYKMDSIRKVSVSPKSISPKRVFLAYT
jgi:hypothetical protein